MSGKRIVKSEVAGVADAHNESLNSRIEGIHGVMNAMGAYIGDTMLTGNAYSRSKQHMSQFYRPMYTGLMNACAEAVVANNRLKGHLSIIKGEDINVPEMEQERDKHLEKARRLRDDAREAAILAIGMFEGQALNRIIVDRLNRQADWHTEFAAEITEALDSVAAFEGAVAGIHDTSISMFAQVASLQSALNGVHFSQTGLTYEIPLTLRKELSNMERLNRWTETAFIENLKCDERGYDWDLIGSLMQSNPKHLTQAQISALTHIYVEMDCVLYAGKYLELGYDSKQVKTAVFEAVSERILTIIGPQAKAVRIPIGSDADKLLYVKYYEIVNPENKRIMNKFLSPLEDAGLAKDILNIKAISYTAPEPYKAVMFKHIGDVKIVDNDKCPICRQQRGHYNPHICTRDPQHYNSGQHAVYVNFSNLNRTNGYNVFFHEIGHAIDYSMGTGNTYASTALFDTLRDDVFGNIKTTISRFSCNQADAAAVFEALIYNGDRSNLTTQQKDIYDGVIVDYIRDQNLWNSRKNQAVSGIYGGFTENKIRTNTNGIIGGTGHSIIHPMTGNPMWYNPDEDSPITGAQNQEFFAFHFASNVLHESERLQANENYFRNATREMEAMIKGHIGD